MTRRRKATAGGHVRLAWGLIFVGSMAIGLSPQAGAQEVTAPATASGGGNGPVHHLRVRSIVHPVASEVIVKALRDAELAGAAVFVLELDTPGGLLTSTRDIFQAILATPVPVVVWVAPAGAQAASAGFFVLQAADIAAMAPGTNTGAAHPVAGSGETIEGVMGEKVEQDAAATIRSLASRAGRNVALAESAVVESRSFTAEEAVREGLADLVAKDLPSLLAAIDGRVVTKADGTRLTVATSGREIQEVKWPPFRRLLAALAHPNVAYILLSLGFIGLYYEVTNPGAVFPGVVGGLCLVLAFFGLSVLPVNYAGVALVVLSLLFFVAEIKVASGGLLTVAGVLALVLGGMMLFETADPALRVSRSLLAGLGLTTLALAGLSSTLILRSHRQRVSTGREGMIGEAGHLRRAIDPESTSPGKVFLHGELWNARADEAIAEGEPVTVAAVDGMTLLVRRKSRHDAPGS